MIYTSTQLAKLKDMEDEKSVNIALNDLLSKLNITNNDVANLNVPKIVTSATYGRYREYPDGTTQGRLLRSVSTTLETGGLGADFTYQSISLVLPIGVWEVIGIASVFSTTAADLIGVSFWDDVAGAEFSNGEFVAGTATAVNQTIPITNYMILPITTGTKTVKLRIKRNGASVANCGTPVAAALKSTNKLIAVSLV